VQVAHRTVSLSQGTRTRLRGPGLWFVLLTLAGTTMLHYLTDIHLIPYHSIYRSLYYVPISVAAVRYGRRGGVLTALTASLLYIPHIILSWNIMIVDGFNDLLENVIFLFVGAFAGSLADAERRQRLRAQEAVTQLAAANAELQTQAALAERMRPSIASILESIDSGVLTFDLAGQINTINHAAQTLLGGPDGIEAAVPQPIRDYLRAGARGYQQIAVAGACSGCTALHSSAGRTKRSAPCWCWMISPNGGRWRNKCSARNGSLRSDDWQAGWRTRFAIRWASPVLPRRCCNMKSVSILRSASTPRSSRLRSIAWTG
jgi:PAS domain-containing protein